MYNGVKYLFLLFLLLFCVELKAQNSRKKVEDQVFSDTLGVRQGFRKSELQSHEFYDKLLKSKSWVGRTLANLIIGGRSSADDAQAIPEMEMSRDYFEKFSGKTITKIRIAQADIFGSGSKDDDLSWTERAVDNMHMRTREWVVRKNLLFHVGDTLQPYTLSINEQMLRNKNYFATSFIVILPDGNDPNGVIVNIFTRDNWSISAGGRLGGEPYLDVFDRNFLGSGNQLLLRTYLYGNEQRPGFEANYTIDNMWGSFINSSIKAGTGATNSTIMISLDKPFTVPNKHFWAAQGGYIESRNGLPLLDTAMAVKHQRYGAFYGYSWNLDPRTGTNIYFTVAGQYSKYNKGPQVSANFNPYYTTRWGALVSVGIAQQNFFQGNMIFGYGRTEDIPYGFRAELMVGKQWNTMLGNRWYGGAMARWGGLTKAGYFDVGVQAGSYFTEQSQWQQAVFSANVNYFSPLWHIGTLYVRQFINLSGTWGYRRLWGERERLQYQKLAGIRGMGSSYYLCGLNRAVINAETVFFTPLFLYHFRFAFFAWGDVGWLGDNALVFKNPFSAAIGLGVRIKNERLIFSNVQIRLGFALKREPGIGYNIFQLTNQQTLDIQPFTPTLQNNISYN